MGLRRSMEMIKALFLLEIEMMKQQLEILAETSQSIIEEQQTIRQSIFNPP